MTYDFFADETDKLDILNFIFQETDLHVYDLGSEFEKEICEYKSTSEISSKFDLINGNKFANTFQLWSSRHKGNPIFRKIKLDSKYCDGYTFRYSTDGLGLIQLYFGGIKNNELNRSHIGHFNEKGALRNEMIKNNDRACDWDWKEVQITSRKLKYYIHNKLSIRKIGSFGILKGADNLEKQGIQFR